MSQIIKIAYLAGFLIQPLAFADSKQDNVCAKYETVKNTKTCTMYMTQGSFNLLKKMQCLENTSISNESSSGFNVTCAEGQTYRHVYPKGYGEFAGPRNIATISIAKQYCNNSCELKSKEND